MITETVFYDLFVGWILVSVLSISAPKIAPIVLCTSWGALCTSRKMVLCTSRGALCTSRKRGPLHVQWRLLYVQEALCTSGRGALCVLYVQGAFRTSMALLCTSRKHSARLWGFSVRPGSLLHVQGLALYVQDAFCTSMVASCTSKGPSVRPRVPSVRPRDLLYVSESLCRPSPPTPKFLKPNPVWNHWQNA